MGNSQSRNQQQASSDLESSSLSEKLEEFEIIRPIVVTGFGKIYPDDPSDEANLSWRVVEKLSETIDYQGTKIPVIKGQPSKEDKNIPEPVKVCYSYVEDTCFKNWLVSTDALVYVHLGVNDKSRVVQLETTGRRDVYFKQDKYSDDDTPSYLSESDDKEPQRTSFQVSTELCNDLEAFKSEITFPVSCSDKSLKLTYQRSDDAGTFLCDFLYYTSLYLAPKKNVLFVHIPGELPGDDLPDDINCYNQCKVDALAEVVEFLVKKLLAQIDAAEEDTAATNTVEQ